VLKALTGARPRCRRTGTAASAQPRQDEDGRRPRAGEVVTHLALARPREGSVDRREADVREGEEDPRVRADGTRRAWTRKSAPSGSRKSSRRERQKKTAASKKKAVAADGVSCPKLHPCRLGDPSRRRSRREARPGSAEGVREARGGAAPRRAASPTRRFRLDRRDRDRPHRPAGRNPAILLAEELACSKVHACIAGGETRTASVRAGLAEVREDALVVLRARRGAALLPEEVIERVLAPLSEGWDGVGTRAAGVGHFLKRVAPDGTVLETVPPGLALCGPTRRPSWRTCCVVRRVAGVARPTDCAGLVEAAGPREGRGAAIPACSR